ncbi:MAG: BrnT family toxin [Lachnospiraceae bacterium]|nr:BrnT family toxin [Lachnospiraceae bacterium]
MKTIIGGYPVEWDDQKNEINKNKHGISFETAALVFADENRIEYFDRLHSVEEDRYVVLGRVNDILFVVYTEREDASRLISARAATAAERRIYYGDC